MRRTAATALLSKDLPKQFLPARGAWGRLLRSLEPKEQEKNGTSEVKANRNEEVNPIVGFARLPPVPPFIGPLVALSLWETWSGRDTDDV